MGPVIPGSKPALMSEGRKRETVTTTYMVMGEEEEEEEDVDVSSSSSISSSSNMTESRMGKQRCQIMSTNNTTTTDRTKFD